MEQETDVKKNKKKRRKQKVDFKMMGEIKVKRIEKEISKQSVNKKKKTR